MPQALKTLLLQLRELLLTTSPFVLLATGLLAGAYWLLQPNPPRKLVLATGVAQGAYDEFGKRYAAQLARHGITVELRPSQGSADNLALLQDADSGVDIAFVQGGTRAPQQGEQAPDHGLVALGSMFYEPVWLFYREDAAKRLLGLPALNQLTQLGGARLNVGAPGSGTPPLMQSLFEANRIAPDALTLLQQALTPAVVDLLAGDLDALALVSAPEALMVQMLLQTPGIRLFDVAQAEAYSRRLPFLRAVTLPRGVVDLARDMPPTDLRLVAPTASLVARESLHPALVQLFVQAAAQVHGGAGWFQRRGDFPNADGAEWPIAAEAQRFYRNGVPWLQRYLPFWLANLADRMWLALLAIIGLLIPLARVLPPLYEFRIRRRVFRWYAQLREVEEAQGQRPAAELLGELDEIEAKVHHITVPLSYADELYALRSHIDMVRRRLRAGDTSAVASLP